MQMTSSKPSNARLAVFECGQHCFAKLLTPMSVNGANANANGATIKLTVKDGSKQCRSVGGDDLV
jgi:hypothetical protein